MTPEQIADAVALALARGGRLWLVSTIGALAPALWALTLLVHLARPYALRTVGKLSLRFGADLWWLAYVIGRDAVLVLTLGVSVTFLMPDLVLKLDLPLTAPLATLFLFWALAARLRTRGGDGARTHRLMTALLVVGATFYFVPQTFAVEASSLPALAGFAAFFDSARNPAWAGPILAASLVGFVATAAWLLAGALGASNRATGGPSASGVSVVR